MRRRTMFLAALFAVVLAAVGCSCSLYVDKKTARPIQVVGTGGDSAGEIDFTDYDSVGEPQAPPADETVAQSSLSS